MKTAINDSKNLFTTGSILTSTGKQNGFKTIMRVKRRDTYQNLWAAEANTDFGHGYIQTTVILPYYEGERLENASLVNGEDFDVFHSFYPRH